MSASATSPPADRCGADWRFLLDRPDLRRVVVDGPLDVVLRSALGAHATTVGPLAGAEPGYDLAVLVRPTSASVARAMVGLTPGGALRLEHQRRWGRGRTRRLLTDAGFEVSTWWHRPALSAAQSLVALDRPRAAATVLRTVAGRGRRGRIEAGLAAAGLVRSTAGDITVLAIDRRGARRRAGGPAVASVDGRTPTCLLTPHLGRSRAIVGVTVTADGRRLDRVVKVARDRADDHLVAAEAEALEHFSRAAGPRSSAPGNHQLVVRASRAVLVEDAAPGVLLDRRRVARDPSAALVAGIRWIDRMPWSPATILREDGRASDLLGDPLRAVAELPTRRGGGRRDLVLRAAPLLIELAGAALPSPFEHGDLGHPNVFVQTDGSLLAIDWERARPAGLPLHDLTFFMAHLVRSLERSTSADALTAATRRALVPGGWADALVRAHCARAGVSASVRPLLVLACWTRHLARLAETPHLAGGSVPHLYDVLWRAAIEDAEASR